MDSGVYHFRSKSVAEIFKNGFTRNRRFAEFPFAIAFRQIFQAIHRMLSEGILKFIRRNSKYPIFN
jgi:hypothetical protein